MSVSQRNSRMLWRLSVVAINKRKPLEALAELRKKIKISWRCRVLASPHDEDRQYNTTSLETTNMYRVTVAFVLLIASTAVSWAQAPSIWKTQQGAILKILSIDSATGNFSGIFISSPTGPCAGVVYDLTGRQRGSQFAFQTWKTVPSDCA